LVPAISLAPEEQEPLQNASVSLSPERITEGVTAKTEVLNEILQQHERVDYSRNWGINE
jgi:hypothetical protein